MTQKCNRCGAPVDEERDRTVCGYGKCVRCCLGCMHRVHYNLSSKQSYKEALAQVEEIARLYPVAAR